MTTYFVDTSALGKRYIPEAGSAWVKGWIDPRASHVIVISALATVEMNSILMRREREGFISTADRISLDNDFLFHVQNEYLVVDLDDDVLYRARTLLVKHPLRTLDALHLSSAMQVNQLFGLLPTFITADTRLLAAAAAEGLTTDDPNAHP